MSLLQIIVLAIVQGFTEFLPISSSGHLVLVPALIGWADQGLAFDVAVHFGTLVAVLAYFHKDVLAILSGLLSMRPGKRISPDAQLGLLVALATIPVGLVGITAHDWIEASLRSPAVIAATTAGFGLLLWLSDALGRKQRDDKSFTASTALLIGCSQIFALIPGTSRSGVTMSAALALGYTRSAAARFSFLLSIPVIVLATLIESIDLVTTGDKIHSKELLIGALFSAVVAYLTIGFFMRFVEKMGMAPFAIYRFILAAILVYVLV